MSVSGRSQYMTMKIGTMSVEASVYTGTGYLLCLLHTAGMAHQSEITQDGYNMDENSFRWQQHTVTSAVDEDL